jgi:hypothetical protein
MGTGSSINPQTIEAWANIVLDIWKDRMMKHDVRNSGSLWTSLEQHVISQSDGNVDKVDFFFNYYGIYVDMGAGRGFAQGNTGDVGNNRDGSRRKRQSKPWYSTAFYGQVKKLGEILQEKYGREAAERIVGFISGSIDSKISSYNAASRERSARNYKRRRQEDGHWTKQGQWNIGFKLENHNYSK